MVLKRPCSNQKINKKPRPLEVILLSMGFSENTSVLDYVIGLRKRIQKLFTKFKEIHPFPSQLVPNMVEIRVFRSWKML